MFSFLLRGQKRKDLQRDYSQDNLCAQKDMLLNKRSVLGSACCYLFSFLSKENKLKSKPCSSPWLCGGNCFVKDPLRVTIQATLFRGGG